MKKVAIIGASYLQAPLILKAKEQGIETHVFAWAADDIGERLADYFYPISIVEKEEILSKCIEIGIDGICSIASDLAAVTVNYVAYKMGLTGNPSESVVVSTNKHAMRKCFEENGDPSPRSIKVTSANDIKDVTLEYPVIVKPIDRSGSRGITKLESAEHLQEAIDVAIDQGFEKAALVEEYVTGKEYSVEYISWEGQHIFLALTQKYTSGVPHFIETGHLEPAVVNDETLYRVKNVVEHALTSLGIRYGASHSELKISESGDVKIIEIGARMGGDLIGSHLVELSTGFDFVSAVLDISLGKEPKVCVGNENCAAIRFVFDKEDIKVLEKLKENDPSVLVIEDVKELTSKIVSDSGSRFGYYLMSGSRDVIEKYMPVLDA